MGWVNGAGDLSPDAIKGDLAGLETGAKTEFDGNIDKCASWNGDFGSRRKREAGDSETEEEASNVPSVMESDSSALGWLKAAVRKTRSAEPGNTNAKAKGKKRNGNNKNKGSKAKKRNGKKNNRKRGNRNGKAKKRNGKKNNRKRGNRNSKAKKTNGKKKNRKKGNRKNKNRGNRKRNGEKRKSKGKKGGKKNGNGEQKEGRNNNGMDASTYNKLWCFDLSLEQILEKCVENKIKN